MTTVTPSRSRTSISRMFDGAATRSSWLVEPNVSATMRKDSSAGWSAPPPPTMIGRSREGCAQTILAAISMAAHMIFNFMTLLYHTETSP